ncbi:hypothetical protein DAMA08_021020 (mitochondrion) [Martiniozyma asiatica (nom. inval.)]|nr:hypothetical protein DAMA08_021020 [Martiniozyma asiatica]
MLHVIMIPITYNIGAYNNDISDMLDNKITIIPYMANFNTIPASKMDPPNGDSECTVGNHVCTGTNGVFTPKPIINPINNTTCNSIEIILTLIVT